MTFEEAQDICERITFPNMNVFILQEGPNWVSLRVQNLGLDKDNEFAENPSERLFTLEEERTISNLILTNMTKATLIETVRDMMFNIHVHEFHEYFKLDEVTVFSPHLKL